MDLIYVELIGKLLRIDRRAPNLPARVWFEDRWIDSFLSNGEVMSYPEARTLTRDPERALELMFGRVGGPAFALAGRSRS